MAGAASFSYDVFLSFRGEDTLKVFTENLYHALSEKGIRTFLDDEELRRGEELTPALVKAIQESRIAIIVFSQNYASSWWCLDELVMILECFEQKKDRMVLPVFYGVDPSDVQHQRGSYGEALTRHEGRLMDDMEKVNKWRKALQQTAILSGFLFDLGDGDGFEFVARIVKEVSSKINDRVPLRVADYPVGLESRVIEVNSLLDVGSDDAVRMVGIHGIGGIGKTTIARAVYNSVINDFEGLCFLEDVRVNSAKYGLVHLQEIVLSEILGDTDINLQNVNQGISIIKHRLCRKKVLLVLDDVDKIEQLQAVVGDLNWFGSGSRVIITTRDKHLLAFHGVERTYEGSSTIESLFLDIPKDKVHSNGPEGEELHWDGEALKKMENLKTLIIRNGRFNKGPTHLPHSLRVLKWWGYPSPSLPSDFHLKKLAMLELPDSCLRISEQIQGFMPLTVLNFNYCASIIRIPDVSGLPNLAKLSFKHCESLIRIHESVGFLDKLRILDAVGCKKLRTFPPIRMPSLEQLNLSHCSVLESFPEILGKMENIRELHITGSPIKELPFSIQNLNRL